MDIFVFFNTAPSQEAYAWVCSALGKIGGGDTKEFRRRSVIEGCRRECKHSKATLVTTPKGPKYLYGTKYGFCSSNFPYGLGKYSPYGYLGPFGYKRGPVPS